MFDKKDAGYANGKPNRMNAQKVIFGIQGGAKSAGVSWRVDDAMVINYVSSHDNNTLWDKLNAASPSATKEELLAMNRLCASVVLLSRGMPFFLAGEEMLRTKGGDTNSYASSDEVNNLNWDALTPDSDEMRMAEFYRELIALRRDKYENPDSLYRFLTEIAPVGEILDNNLIAVTWADEDETVLAYAVINPLASEAHLDPPAGFGAYRVVLRGDAVTADGEIAEGPFTVDPVSVTLIVAAE